MDWTIRSEAPQVGVCSTTIESIGREAEEASRVAQGKARNGGHPEKGEDIVYR